MACTKIVIAAGVRNVIGCDQAGAIYRGRRENMNWVKEWYAQNTDPTQKQHTVHKLDQESAAPQKGVGRGPRNALDSRTQT